MDYKNFFLRSLFSFLFLSIYILISIINFNFIFYLILFLYLSIFIEIYNYFNKYKIVPLIYIFISLLFFLSIEFNNENYIRFNLFIFTIIIFDTFSYVFGKTIGKNKLIKLSPNKTVEGFVGGLLSAIIFNLSFSYFFDYEITILFILYSLFIIIFAFFGDIIESFFKRKNYLKNSSELIPGHGGIFDRFDSFLFSIIFYSVSNNILT